VIRYQVVPTEAVLCFCVGLLRPPVVVRPARLAVSAVASALVIVLALAVPSGTPLPRLLPVLLVHPLPVHPVRGSSKD
jgi:hypothetical protein